MILALTAVSPERLTGSAPNARPLRAAAHTNWRAQRLRAALGRRGSGGLEWDLRSAAWGDRSRLACDRQAARAYRLAAAARLVLAGFASPPSLRAIMNWESPPQRQVCPQLEHRTRSVQPPAACMDSPWVNHREFLDRPAPFECGAGRSVVVLITAAGPSESE